MPAISPAKTPHPKRQSPPGIPTYLRSSGAESRVRASRRPNGHHLSYYQRALALRPQWEEGWRNLGTLYYASARYSDAIPALKNAVAINASDGNGWALLGLSEFETKDYQNSLIHLERGHDLGFAGNAAAIQIAKYHLAVLLNRSGEFNRASELLSSQTASGPLNDQVKFALGMALLRIPHLPDELDHSMIPLVTIAGEDCRITLRE